MLLLDTIKRWLGVSKPKAETHRACADDLRDALFGKPESRASVAQARMLRCTPAEILKKDEDDRCMRQEAAAAQYRRAREEAP